MHRLQHSRVVQLLGVIMEDGNYSLVMEYLEKGDLMHVLKAQVPRPESAPCQLLGAQESFVNGWMFGIFSSQSLIKSSLTFHAQKVGSPSSQCLQAGVHPSLGGSPPGLSVVGGFCQPLSDPQFRGRHCLHEARGLMWGACIMDYN